MNKRAEEAALKAYPDYPTMDGGYVTQRKPRKVFIQGYEAAEKDLAPLIEAATIVYEAWNGGTMDDVRREMVELGKRIMEAKR